MAWSAVVSPNSGWVTSSDTCMCCGPSCNCGWLTCCFQNGDTFRIYFPDPLVANPFSSSGYLYTDLQTIAAAFNSAFTGGYFDYPVASDCNIFPNVIKPVQVGTVVIGGTTYNIKIRIDQYSGSGPPTSAYWGLALVLYNLDDSPADQLPIVSLTETSCCSGFASGPTGLGFGGGLTDAFIDCGFGGCHELGIQLITRCCLINVTCQRQINDDVENFCDGSCVCLTCPSAAVMVFCGFVPFIVNFDDGDETAFAVFTPAGDDPLAACDAFIAKFTHGGQHYTLVVFCCGTPRECDDEDGFGWTYNVFDGWNVFEYSSIAIGYSDHCYQRCCPATDHYTADHTIGALPHEVLGLNGAPP